MDFHYPVSNWNMANIYGVAVIDELSCYTEPHYNA